MHLIFKIAYTENGIQISLYISQFMLIYLLPNSFFFFLIYLLPNSLLFRNNNLISEL